MDGTWFRLQMNAIRYQCESAVCSSSSGAGAGGANLTYHGKKNDLLFLGMGFQGPRRDRFGGG